jgi:hypothetical protein
MKANFSEPIELHHAIIIKKDGTKVLLVKTDKPNVYECHIEPQRNLPA